MGVGWRCVGLACPMELRQEFGEEYFQALMHNSAQRTMELLASVDASLAREVVQGVDVDRPSQPPSADHPHPQAHAQHNTSAQPSRQSSCQDMAALNIQRVWRGHQARQKYLDLLYEQFLESERKRDSMEAHVFREMRAEEQRAKLEEERLVRQLSRQETMGRKWRAAFTIQEAWKRHSGTRKAVCNF